MSHVLKNNLLQVDAAWQPSASIETLRARAKILNLIRNFFSERDVLEVETPLIGHTSVTDPFIESIPVFCKTAALQAPTQYYLQTSPEYAMKRLLASGSGAIFQITKAFRQEELGRFHNPEFTMLEWYRPQFDHHALMDEVDELLQFILKTERASRYTYQQLFEKFFAINPHTATSNELMNCASEQKISVATQIHDRDTWLQLLMSHCIEPTLGETAPCFVFDFPATQAALARIKGTDPAIASRFEVYFHGIELANGFHELQDVHEQRQRFLKNNDERQNLHLSTLPIDEFFLASLAYGLPDCAGVALGIDRLIMLATKSLTISEVISFDFLRV